MENITIVGLLDSYRRYVGRGDVQFLEKDSRDQKEVLELIQPLLRKMREAEGKPGGLSDNLDWHETHKAGRSLWETLVRCAVRNIDRVAKGNSKLFAFARAVADFEDLLYGMTPHYRDHTLHSLWVYLMGEYILRDRLPEVYKSLDWYVHNTLSDDSSSPRRLRDEAQQKEKKLLEGADRHKDAAWCLMALCHDLGYSLSELQGLNERVKKVIGFLDLPGFTRIGYSFEMEHQYLGSEFLELMAGDVWIVPSPDEKEALIKNFREAASYWRLCRSLEKRQHGIYSSFIIYKLLDIFADSWVRDPAEAWGLEESEAVDNLIRGNILFAIAQHEFEFAHLNTMGSLADILVLADELEEFSRFGRQLQARKYRDTMADVSISFTPTKTPRGRDLSIDITYEVAEHQKPEEFYVRKAEMLCKKYSLDVEDDDSTRGFPRYLVRHMKMTVKQTGNEFSFCLSSDQAKTEGQLPKAKIGEHPAGTYRLSRYDDKITVSTKEGGLTLQEWFGLEAETE